MKSEKGITLVSLIVYVVVMLIVMTIISVITSYFYANVNNRYEESKQDYGESDLDMYLANDLKNKEINVLFINPDTNTQIKIKYNDNSYVIYTITTDGIYRNRVKIYSGDTSEMEFKLTDIDTGVIQEKKLFEIIKGTDIFKSYTINIKSQAVYE